ncbi:MAG: hypothetical protein K9I68_05340 [Bacteroidales bacterium]|nr:hypothetical protein [Bacteroidales bacterium]MCF8338273.1 hypothetical protein [Bacteroidales bacterium]
MSNFTGENFHSYLENIIASYEDHLKKMQTAFQSSEVINKSATTLLDHVNNSLNEQKKEREALNIELRKMLAANGSVRKKDYDEIMSDIFYVLEEKEKKTENQFNAFIEAQKDIAEFLKNSLLDLKKVTSQDDDKISAIRKQLISISKQQENNKEKILNSFRDFQRTHNHIMVHFRKLLEQENIGVKDIKKIKEQIDREISTQNEHLVK